VDKPLLDPKEPFFKGSAFALPLSCVGDRQSAIERVLGRALRPRFALVEGYKLRVLVIPGRVRGILAHTLILAELGFTTSDPELAFFTVQVNGRLLPLVTSHRARVVIQLPDLVIGSSETTLSEQREHGRTAEIYRPLLETCSRLTGEQIYFHVNKGQIVPPFPITDGILHLVPGATPPGERGTQWLQYAFGHRIQKDLEWVSCQRATRGRGITITDGDKRPIVQIVGRTVYALFPLISFYHGRESQRSFAEMLRASYNRLSQETGGSAPDVPTPRVRRKDVLAALRFHAEDTPRHWEQRLEEVEREIGLAQDRLRHHMALRAEMRAIKQGFEESDRFKGTLARLSEDSDLLLKHPLVARVFGHDEGLHVETTLIVATYEDARYELGRFQVRIGLDNKPSVWAIETRHPQGIPHPHLLHNGTPCFGTATDAILEAGADLRFADCFLNILRWLAEGYAPETAGARIGEWPIASIKGESA
jgi:hypothetical protein